MKVKISKKALNELVDILIDILDSSKLEKIKLDNFLIRVSILPFYTDKTFDEKKEQLKFFISSLDDEMIAKFYEFNKRYLNWLIKYYPELETKFIRILDFEVDNSSFEDEFFDFDSEKIDKTINDMHYKDIDKIDATSFMNKYGVDDDLIEDLKNYLSDFHNLTLFHLKLNYEFLQVTIKILDRFIYLLEVSIEFKDLAKGLKNFKLILKKVNLEKLGEKEKKVLKIFIESIFDDIEKWIDEVLIKQTAKDIHYLDASLLANIAQIELIIGNNINGKL